MENNFAEEYKTEMQYREGFKAAEATKNTAVMDAIRCAHNELVKKIEAKGTWYARLFVEYSKAMECGNELINWDDALSPENAVELVKALRELGIEKFTFSSGWTNANEAAWVMMQNGCKLLGMVEINSNHKSFGREDYDKVHGYLFEV